MTTINDIQPGQHFVVATEGMRGHFACEFWMNNQDFSDYTFSEPWRSDYMSYTTREEAIKRAEDLAAELELPFVI